MKNIKRFEQFSYLQEGNEAGFLQRDPMVGAADLYKDMYADIKKQFGTSLSEVQPKLNDLVDKLIGKLNQSQIENAVKKAEKYFGLPADKITYSVIKNKLQRMNESNNSENPFSEPKNLLENITQWLTAIFSLNFMTLGIPSSIIIAIIAQIKYGSEEVKSWNNRYIPDTMELPSDISWIFGLADPMGGMFVSLLAAFVFLILTALLKYLGNRYPKLFYAGNRKKNLDNLLEYLGKEFKNTYRHELIDNNKILSVSYYNGDNFTDSDKWIEIHSINKNNGKVLKIIVHHKWPGELSSHESRSFEDFSEDAIEGLKYYVSKTFKKPADKPASIASMTTKPVQPEENKIQPAPAEKQTKPEAKNPQTNRGFLQKPGKIYDWVSYSNR